MQPTLEPARYWTYDDLVAEVPAEADWRRYEIVDGALVVSPPPAPDHEFVITHLAHELIPQAPVGASVVGASLIDMAPTYRVPDVTVVADSVFGNRDLRTTPDQVLLTVEVVSPGSVTTDRITKPAQYAAAGVRNFWRIETAPELRLTAYALDGETYREVGSWGPGETAALNEPFPLTVVVDRLRPPAAPEG